ncbi:bacteriocin biosynthesis cyclodehydratase domain-containing protein [Amycolatopsis arida]|uniref:Bacteriocin biosynthesis cyclodehydratase domain-containing protein n=1 Tax=Amycolatopsis arida TaxID=587909 RepID=A0A1I5MMN2_9PSEU|nr:hypothetical protein [Amycolatopsis arida]TDX94139.1 bacteriocin biosynthesis cyclodehydratase domain-containing protein [Amycolatopsis arida]SFP10780.1 bacteriocin biosynthesis cyclodehydratase domain-containing protein [Amycolatopsis arida]
MEHSQPAVALPRRPRLLPGLEVLERKPDEVQVGLDPRHAVVADELPSTVIDMLRTMDGTRTVDALLEQVNGDDSERLRGVLTGLARFGLLEDASNRRGRRTVVEPELWPLRAGMRRHDVVARRERCALAVYGGGRLAVAVSVLLATAGVGQIDVRAPGLVTASDLGSGLLDGDVGRERGEAIAAAIHRANSRTRTTRIGGGRRPDLALLTDAVVPAPEVVHELVADGVPHLPVRIRDGIGIIGPLVFPGRSTCLRCADLTRADLDECWPRVASQLAGRMQHAELSAVQAAAALATTQVLRVLSHTPEPPPVWNATLEIDTYDGKVWHRPWDPHPDCRCGAFPPGGLRPEA